MSEWKTLMPLAAGVTWTWQLTYSDDSVLGDGELGLFEHLIHELAHFASLKIYPTAQATWAKDRSSISLRGDYLWCTAEQMALIMRSMRDKGVREETRAWAIEWYMWRGLGLVPTFTKDDLYSAAADQGCVLDDVDRLIETNSPALRRQTGFALNELRGLCSEFEAGKLRSA